MKEMKWAAVAVVCIMIGMNFSCSNDMYNQEKAQEHYDSVSPVDSVDANHTWVLTKSRALIVEAPEGGNAERVKILTANPRETGKAEVVGDAWISDGEKITMNVTCPSTVTTLYAALVDKEGKYSITPFDVESESNIGFSNLIVDHEKLSYEPQPQQYTYCFEETYPLPGDFDYNDVVMRISLERSGEREVRIHVQLAAVGASNQVAGALRLAGFKYSDIESVKTVDSLSFNTTNGEDFPKDMRTVVSTKEFYNSFLSQGRNNEAVINLFGDAHWATGDLLEVNFGIMKRKKYNVSKRVSDDNQQFVPRTVTYIVTFKSASGLNSLSMDQLDPFIMNMYNGGVFEAHIFPYRDANILNAFSPSSIKTLPWALCIPKSDFRWPIEGVNIGFIMTEIKTFGAYQTYRHSFGEWAMDRTRSIDWYEYPTENQVF